VSLSAILRVFAAAALLFAVIVGGVVLFAERDQNGAGATAGATGAALIGGAFTLTDQTGKTRTDADFRGKYMLVYFGYTYCPDFCPTELNTIGEALGLLGADAAKVQPIFITVDPARDTVEQMKLYAQSFDPRLVALTGTAEQIAVVAKAYRVYYAKAPGASGDDYLMDHSTFIYLMGPDGAYLTHFRYGMSAQDMAAGIRKYF
jgi:cytochrome oxidase Cu insertion factor (SCO1/SenC/PrrC family)